MTAGRPEGIPVGLQRIRWISLETLYLVTDRYYDNAENDKYWYYFSPFSLKNAEYFLSVFFIWFVTQSLKNFIISIVIRNLPLSKSFLRSTAFLTKPSCSF